MYYDDEDEFACDDCGEIAPSGHGFYPEVIGRDDVRVCGECVQQYGE